MSETKLTAEESAHTLVARLALYKNQNPHQSKTQLGKTLDDVVAMVDGLLIELGEARAAKEEAESLVPVAEKLGMRIERRSLPGQPGLTWVLTNVRAQEAERSADEANAAAIAASLDAADAALKLAASEAGAAALREACSQILGQQHVLKYALDFVGKWGDDPVFVDPAKRKTEVQRVVDAVAEWHRRIVEAGKGDAGKGFFSREQVERIAQTWATVLGTAYSSRSQPTRTLADVIEKETR